MARLDTIQAIVLNHKLPNLEGWNEQRRRIARIYGQSLRGIGDLLLPPVPAGSDPVWHLYVVRTAGPGALADFQREGDRNEANTVPTHLSEAYRRLGLRRGAFLVTEASPTSCSRPGSSRE